MASRVRFSKTIDQGMTAHQTVVHPQNNSTSKQQFSFPRASRFPCKSDLADYTFYALPSTKSKVSALIGNQKRVLFEQQKNQSPAPGRYDTSVDGDFEYYSKRKRRGFYMGLGRSQIKINNFLGGSKQQGPNPLKYCNPEQFSTLQRHQFSFTRQKKFATLKKLDLQTVGPGSYKIDTSLDEHKQILSSQVKPLCPKIQEVKVDNRKKRMNTQPPLYCPMVTAKGEMLRFDSHRGVRIGTSKRSNLVKGEEIPGPGNYKVFSEFLSKGKS